MLTLYSSSGKRKGHLLFVPGPLDKANHYYYQTAGSTFIATAVKTSNLMQTT
jgi:hypothetical protein